MHIIKITPKSFKIILSKEDLQRYGVENILESPDVSGELFTEIIEKTNSLYGSPFTEGAIDAEFFESKDGGGELFITKHICQSSDVTYLFTAKDSDVLTMLCKRLKTVVVPNESRLYFDSNRYKLVLHFGSIDEMTKAVISEYGDFIKVGKMNLWQLEEHGRCLCESEAIAKIAEW